MSRAAAKRKSEPEQDALDLSRARITGRGIHAQRGVHMSLRALRTGAGATQVGLSGSTGIAQGDLSRLEQRESLDDVQVATLRRYIDGLGGKLELAAVLPHGHRIVLVGASKATRSSD